MGSSAADSQLATARSQLRFQSAAFSSSLQTATQTILDQNNKTTEEKTKTKNTRKRGHFQSSDGVAQRKLSLEQPYFVPRWRGLKTKAGVYYGVQQARMTSNSTIVFQTALPTANTASTCKMTSTVQRLCPGSLPRIVSRSAASLNYKREGRK